MPSCRVNDCSNRSGGGVRLFSIPKRSRDIEIAKKWLKSVWDRELDEEQFALLMKEEFRVCAEHFIETDFDARGKLKSDAVPSRFPWNGGQQRASILNKARSVPSEHKSNGVLVNKLSRAIRVAETIVDGEIKDIDRWIAQLEAQVEHLRYKREKLVSHKIELSRSLGCSVSVKSELSSLGGQSSLSNDFLISNGTNNLSNPGESPILSTDFAAESAIGDSVLPEHLEHMELLQQRLKSKPVRRPGDEFMDVEGYSFDSAALSTANLSESPEAPPGLHNCLPHEEQEEMNYSAVTFSSAHNNSHRHFATRRKRLKPTRRIDITRPASDNSSDEKFNPLPSSSNFATTTLTPTATVTTNADSPHEPMALSLNDGNVEHGEEQSSGQQCD